MYPFHPISRLENSLSPNLLLQYLQYDRMTSTENEVLTFHRPRWWSLERVETCSIREAKSINRFQPRCKAIMYYNIYRLTINHRFPFSPCCLTESREQSALGFGFPLDLPAKTSRKGHITVLSNATLGEGSSLAYSSTASAVLSSCFPPSLLDARGVFLILLHRSQKTSKAEGYYTS